MRDPAGKLHVCVCLVIVYSAQRSAAHVGGGGAPAGPPGRTTRHQLIGADESLPKVGPGWIAQVSYVQLPEQTVG